MLNNVLHLWLIFITYLVITVHVDVHLWLLHLWVIRIKQVVHCVSVPPPPPPLQKQKEREREKTNKQTPAFSDPIGSTTFSCKMICGCSNSMCIIKMTTKYWICNKFMWITRINGNDIAT